MLTLDDTTLYYFSLFSPSETKKGRINNWTSTVSSFGAPQQKNEVRGGSKSSQVPSLTDGTTRASSRSALTDVVVLTSHKNNHSPSTFTLGPTASDIDWLHGIDDADERKGEERDAAAASPIKGKVRLSSTVISLLSM